MGRKFHMVAFVVKVFSATVVIVATLVSVYLLGPALETRFWPAVSKLRIVSLTENADHNAVLMAEFTKLRGECEYIGIAWFRGSPDGEFERVPVTLMRQAGDTSSPNRPTGTQRAGPWIVGMTAEELQTNSFARLMHRCVGLWTTVTEFWP